MSKARRSRELDAMEREAIVWVQKLSPGEATPADAEALKRWCAQSPAHDAAFVEAKRVWRTVGAAGRVLHDDQDEDFLSVLDELRQRRKIVSRRSVLGGGIAALAAVSVYGAVNPPLGLWPSLSELNADYRTRTGEQRNVMLAGNLAINLNTQTSLSIRSTDPAEDRIELIAGEASFATFARASRSLVVLAAGGKAVTESGRFDVRCLTSIERSPVSVTCFEGKVRIEHGAKAVDLRPGQRLQYDANGPGNVSAVDPMLASDWQRGIIEFRGTLLVDAVEEINRYRPGRIILTNTQLGQKQLSGRFRIDQMNMVLLQLEQAFSVRLQRLPGGIVLLS